MKYLRRFNESIGVYNKDWEKFLPDQLEIIKEDKHHKFQKGNVMLNADMIQITYSNTEYGYPNTLEFDIYFIHIPVGMSGDGKLKLDIDITYGDLVVSEFSITPPNKIKIIEDTSYGSKFDPTNTIFALTNESLSKLIQFLNKFKDMSLSIEHFKFLSESQSMFWKRNTNTK